MLDDLKHIKKKIIEISVLINDKAEKNKNALMNGGIVFLLLYTAALIAFVVSSITKINDEEDLQEQIMSQKLKKLVEFKDENVSELLSVYKMDDYGRLHYYSVNISRIKDRNMQLIAQYADEKGDGYSTANNGKLELYAYQDEVQHVLRHQYVQRDLVKKDKQGHLLFKSLNISGSDMSIKYVSYDKFNSDEKIQEKVLIINPMAIKYIKNPSENILYFLLSDLRNILDIPSKMERGVHRYIMNRYDLSEQFIKGMLNDKKNDHDFFAYRLLESGKYNKKSFIRNWAIGNHHFTSLKNITKKEAVQHMDYFFGKDNLSDESLYEDAINHFFNLEVCSAEMKAALINHCPQLINYLKHPSVNLQKALIDNDLKNYFHIKNPSKKIRRYYQSKLKKENKNDK